MLAHPANLGLGPATTLLWVQQQQRTALLVPTHRLAAGNFSDTACKCVCIAEFIPNQPGWCADATTGACTVAKVWSSATSDFQCPGEDSPAGRCWLQTCLALCWLGAKRPCWQRVGRSWAPG